MLVPSAAKQTGQQASLITRAQAGDRDAFDELYRQTIKEMKAWVAYRCHRWDMVEECLQQTYITAYRRLHVYEVERPFTPWLKGVARNVIGKYLQNLRPQVVAMEQVMIDRHLHRLDEEAAEHAELGPRLDSCLQRLPDHLRRLVWRRYADGDSVNGLADETGRSANAISVALHRAREALRQCLGGETHG